MVQLEFHAGIADVDGLQLPPAAQGLQARLARGGVRRARTAEPARRAVVDLRAARVHPAPARARRRCSPAPRCERTPIWLVDAAVVWPPADVAINLGDAPLDEPQRVARVLELVGDEPEAASGRPCALAPLRGRGPDARAGRRRGHRQMERAAHDSRTQAAPAGADAHRGDHRPAGRSDPRPPTPTHAGARRRAGAHPRR